ncbi:hypothetical protein LPJ78_001010 [Coemansia sp. RSA 989]|nr:hypothetical protein BX667DRAFT_193853 [Coemansia mojavensis]KAJ1740408.1 hypothetical protein LPJ68_003807 [Coemansia sp. RSA 1086]KAJ1752030.1 hypothetical protein LPJ79_001553 [Coemansia sp. RSA 1821]KAJ1867454.1 hypothetical protein LPJ78_001010 [Coemansia sp. RSA 989]KAJ1874891.1 hypothetical protein LPJ55_001105 [Coemansia sp. RSA 990]KAJ2649147.1 hypothetical protein IWW40_003409 [Coemansia sp. RSA 1250]KAJ2671558.1 hypothetical protein IWW42_003343 [Coemansia sp. RSA 1085]
MASRLDQPLTNSKGSPIDYGAENRSGQRDYDRSSQHSRTLAMPTPYNPHEDGGMQNLQPPDYDSVYPEAEPAGPSAANNLGRHAQTVECPWCHAVVTTRVKRRLGYKAGGAAVVVAVIAWPLFWVPLLVPGLHRKIHYCPQCRRKIGRGRRHNT